MKIIAIVQMYAMEKALNYVSRDPSSGSVSSMKYLGDLGQISFLLKALFSPGVKCGFEPNCIIFCAKCKTKNVNNFFPNKNKQKQIPNLPFFF